MPQQRFLVGFHTLGSLVAPFFACNQEWCLTIILSYIKLGTIV